MAEKWDIEYTPLNGVTFGYNNTGNRDIDKINKELFDDQVKKDKKARQAEDKRLDTERAGIKKQKDLEYTNAVAQMNLLKDKIKGASPEERPALTEQLVNKQKEIQDIYSDLNNYANLASYKSYLNPAKETAGQTATAENGTQKESQGTDTNTANDKQQEQGTNTDTNTASDKQQEQGTNTVTTTTTTTSKGRSPYSYGMIEGHGSPTDPSGKSQQLRNQAQMHERQAMDEQKNSQANMQVANRNYRVEAEKNAVSQAASENAQKVANMGNASAGAAALERGVSSADYNTHMQRQDQQRAEGVKNQREMWGSKQTAEEERGSANITDYEWRDMDRYNRNAAQLSDGGEEKTTVQKQENQQPVVEEKQEEPQQPRQLNASPQHVINALLGSSLGEDIRNGTAQNKDDIALYNYVINTYGVQAAPQDTYKEASGDNAKLYESMWLKDKNYGGQKKQAMDFLRQGRAGKDNDASINYIPNKDGTYTAIAPGKGNMNMQVSAQQGATGEFIPNADNGIWTL